MAAVASWRSYTDQEKAAAVGRALAVGAKKAALELGIPRRTISSWLQSPPPGVQAAIVQSRTDVAARLWEGVVAGTEAVVTGLRDPKARLGDKANALRIVVEAHALITGGPTARTENLNVNAGMNFEPWKPGDPDPAEKRRQEREALAEIERLGSLSDDELQAWLLNGKDDEPSGLEQLRTMQQRLLAAENPDG